MMRLYLLFLTLKAFNFDNMENVFQAVRETVYEEAHRQYAIPDFVEIAVDLFGKAHLYYRAVKSYRLFRRAESEGRGHPAIYGAALHLAGDYTRMGSYALKIALVAKCAEDILHQYRHLYQSLYQLKQTYYQRFPIYQPFKGQSPSSYFSPFFKAWIQVDVIGFMRQLLKTAACAIKALGEAFKLSMCLRDAYLLANGDPQAKYEACTELVGDWERYLTQIKDDHALLKEEVAKRRQLADRILSKLDPNRTTVPVLSYLEGMVRQAGNLVANEWGNIQQTGEDTLDAVLPSGRIAPLHIGLGEGQEFVPALPKERYPPWAGQLVDLPPLEVQAPPLTEQILQVIQQVAPNPLNIFVDMASKVRQIYQDVQPSLKTV